MACGQLLDPRDDTIVVGNIAQCEEILDRRQIGFLPQQHADRVKKLKEYKAYPMTMVFYEALHRIEKCLQDCMDVFGDRNMVLARELTKIHEEFLRGKISEILPIVPELKGEMVIVMEGNQED